MAYPIVPAFPDKRNRCARILDFYLFRNYVLAVENYRGPSPSGQPSGQGMVSVQANGRIFDSLVTENPITFSLFQDRILYCLEPEPLANRTILHIVYAVEVPDHQGLKLVPSKLVFSGIYANLACDQDTLYLGEAYQNDRGARYRLSAFTRQGQPRWRSYFPVPPKVKIFDSKLLVVLAYGQSSEIRILNAWGEEEGRHSLDFVARDVLFDSQDPFSLTACGCSPTSACLAKISQEGMINEYEFGNLLEFKRIYAQDLLLGVSRPDWSKPSRWAMVKGDQLNYFPRQPQAISCTGDRTYYA